MNQKKKFDSDEEEEESILFSKEKKSESDEDSDAVLEDSEAEIDDRLLAESDSDDDAPDDVGFGESKKSVLHTVKAAMQQIEASKQQKKTKRKQKEELYTQQKKKRLEALEKNRLPDDLVDAIEEKPVEQSHEKAVKEDEVDDDILDIPDEELAEHLIDETDEGFGTDEVGTDDFIPLESGEEGVKAVALQEVGRQKSSAQRAAEFRMNRLYGNKVNRQPVQDMLAQRKKRRTRVK